MLLTYQKSLRSENDAEAIANLLRKGWVETVAPSHDPATQHAAEWIDGEWIIRDKTASEIDAETRTVWANPAEFLAQFSMQQLAAISLSENPTIAALRLVLATWQGEIWSDDPRIVLGIDTLWAEGILT